MDRYEEAMARFKEWERKHPNGYVIEEMAKYVFPELAESEDERIRKELQNFLWRIANGEMNDRGTMPSAKMCQGWIAYLEKQKEQPTDAKSELVIEAARSVLNNWLDDTDCPDVSGDFAELEYAIREYDGEEKQKEQKPNIELIQRSWYMEGYHDGEFSREPKWIIKTGEGGPKYEKNEKYGQPLGQKPAEWSEEDEKMLRTIISDGSRGVELDSKQIDFLKSLRPRQKQDGVWITKEQFEQIKSASYLTGRLDRWKPSEEQMASLAWWRRYSGNLESLYNELSEL